MRKIFILLTAIFCCTANKSFSQTDQSDSSLYQQSIQNVIEVYYKSVGENSHLYNGSEYVPYNYQGNKNPYFETGTLQNAAIGYDGVVYNNVPLAYDIYKEEVIINKYNQNFRIKLVNDKITWFSVLDHTFIRIVRDSSNSALPVTGFYDKLYSGTVTVLAKRKKKIEETITLTGANVQ